MYKIIEGHKYDTETAREMARDAEHLDDSLHYVRETLYRTKTGLYFLHGEGGPMTRYGAECGSNQWSGSAKIVPLTEDAAKAWAEQHCDGQTYERIFGDPDDGPVRQLNIKLSRRDADRLEAIKKATGLTYTELISGWIWSQRV